MKGSIRPQVHKQKAVGGKSKTCAWLSLRVQEMAKDIWAVLHVRSFQLLVLQVSMQWPAGMWCRACKSSTSVLSASKVSGEDAVKPGMDVSRVSCHALQGVVGSMPWVALGFNTLYLQLLGFSDMRAAVLQALFLLGASLGSFGGGYVGETAPPATGYSSSFGGAFKIGSAGRAGI